MHEIPDNPPLPDIQRPDIQQLPYCADSVGWLMAVRHLPQAIWLDSGRPGSTYGRFDIISAAPQVIFETQGDITRITQLNGQVTQSKADPFQLIQDHLPPLSPRLGELPFYGGALGYFGYDLGRRLEQLPRIATPDIQLPDMSVGIYPWAIVQDHQLRQAWFIRHPGVGQGYDFSSIQAIVDSTAARGCEKTPNKNLFNISKFEGEIKADYYHKAVRIIQDYIRAGDCYQVNFAQRFSAQFTGDPLVAYLALRTALPAPFSGFMQMSDSAVLSLSPERFIQVRGARVETQPIKGTIQRGRTPAEDQKNAHTLQHSAKDRAENVMIVDLLRNDLSKHCQDVQVPTLCALQSFANVHHLVSTVTATLKPHASCIDVLRDSFPGGSITGAPKIRAMEIIEELEPTRRSLYCGSLGYISVDGQMDTSIAIRTLVCDRNHIHCWGGGGIVADSESEQEYQESLTKINVLMDTLESQFKTVRAQ